MTERTEETRPEERLEGRCSWGCKSPNPCRREGVAYLNRSEDPHDLVCAEHAHVVDCVDEEEELHKGLDTLSEWIAGLDEYDRAGALGTAAMRARDELLGKYLAAAVKVHAAKLIAEQGPPEECGAQLTLDKAEELARLVMRADALNNARAIIEDVPEDLLGRHGRWEMAAALDAASDTAAEEYERFRTGLGLPALQPENGGGHRSCA